MGDPMEKDIERAQGCKAIGDVRASARRDEDAPILEAVRLQWKPQSDPELAESMHSLVDLVVNLGLGAPEAQRRGARPRWR